MRRAAGSPRCSTWRSAPRRPLARQQQRVAGMRRHQVEVVQHRDDGAALARASPGARAAGRPAVRASTAVNGSSSSITGASCTHQAGEQQALELPGRQRADRPRARTRPGRRGPAPPAPARRCAGRRARNAPQRGRRPSATTSRQVIGKAAVELRALRQQRDAAREPAAVDAAGSQPVQPGDGAQQRRLARAVGPDHRGQAAGREACRTGDAPPDGGRLRQRQTSMQHDRARQRSQRPRHGQPQQRSTARPASSSRGGGTPAVGASGSTHGYLITLHRAGAGQSRSSPRHRLPDSGAASGAA